MVDILSRVGIGNATVDLRVPDTLTQGETVTASVDVEGGNSEQEVEDIYATLRTKDVTDDESQGASTLHKWTLVSDGFTIHPDTSETYDVDLYVPKHAPTTTVARGNVPVWIDTGLDIEMAVDPDDRDYVDIEPGAEFAALHTAITDELGFDPHTQGIGVWPGMNNLRLEVEYKPTRGSRYADALDELEVLLGAETDRGITVRIEVDEAGTSMFELDETTHELEITSTDPSDVADQVAALIND